MITISNKPAIWWPQQRLVWIIFTDEADMWITRLLRPGFRHCYVLYNDGHGWVSFDQTANYFDVAVYSHVPNDFDLPNWLRSHGSTVIPARITYHDRSKPFPLGPMTCVETAKRFLGIRRRRLLTPFQLYRRLMSDISTEESLHA